MKFITKLRRDRWRDQVIDNGQRLSGAYRLREDLALGGETDLSVIDALIDRLTRRRDRLLTNLKETA